MTHMRSRLRKTLDIILILITLASLVKLAARFVSPHISTSKQTQGAPAIQVGDRFGLGGLPANRTLILATSRKCKFCQSSIDFHSRIIQKCKRSGIPIILLVPSGEDFEEHLQALRTSRGDVSVRAELLWTFGVRATPMLLLVEDGLVLRMWVGKLGPLAESSLLESDLTGNTLDMQPSGHNVKSSSDRPQQLTTHPALNNMGKGARLPLSHLSLSERLEERDLDRVPLGEIVLVDVRQREEYRPRIKTFADDTRNIPIDELYSRYYELLRLGKPVVLDCGAIPAEFCRLAVSRLSGAGIRNIAILDEGQYSSPACTSSATK